MENKITNRITKRKAIAVLLAIVLLSGCASSKNRWPVLTGTIAKVDEYGDLIPSFKAKDVLDAGYEYGDILAVKIGDLEEMNMPFVTAYTDVGTMGICFCDYNKRMNDITIAITNADFQSWIGGNEGDSLTVRMERKKGFLKEYEAVQVTMTNDRNDYASDETFANFREVSVPNVAKGVLYRSSNPFNPTKNKFRYSYASDLARKSGISTIINLADTNEKIEAAFASEGYNAPYAQRLYRKGNVIALGMAADFFKKDSLEKIRQAIRFMISHPGPYLIHCNEGKDRAGGFAAILEAVAGASAQDIKDDYMITYMNYYHLEKDGEKYKELEKITIDHLLYLFCNPDMVERLNTIDWSQVDTSGIDIRKGVENYLLTRVGITRSEYNRLESILTGKLTVR